MPSSSLKLAELAIIKIQGTHFSACSPQRLLSILGEAEGTVLSQQAISNTRAKKELWVTSFGIYVHIIKASL